MKEDRLESFIRNNRDEFDHLSPSPELWNNINQKMNAKPKVIWFKSTAFRAAAIVVVVLVSSAIIYRTAFIGNSNKLASNVDPEIKELIEAEAYYAHQVSFKLKEIQKCYKMIPELQGEVEGDLIELESMYNDLKKDLKENLANKNVIEAMIENNRYRLRVVDDVLQQINC